MVFSLADGRFLPSCWERNPMQADQIVLFLFVAAEVATVNSFNAHVAPFSPLLAAVADMAASIISSIFCGSVIPSA